MPMSAARTANPRLHAGLLLLAAGAEAGYLGIFSLGNLKEHVETFIALALAQGILYFVAIYVAERLPATRSNLLLIVAAAVIFRLTLFWLPATLSDDLYRYHWDGRIQHAGYNPYLVRPDDPALHSFQDEYPAISGPEHTSLYGPLMELVFWSAGNVLPGLLGLKVVFVLFDVGVVFALLRLLPRFGMSPLRSMVYAWSPLVIVEFAGSGHNDSLPIFGVAAALLCLSRGHPRLSIAAITASALSKLYAGFLLPVFLQRASWRLAWMVAALAAATFVPYIAGASHLAIILTQYSDRWRNNESLFLLLRSMFPEQWHATAYVLIVGSVVLYCVVRRLSPDRSAYLVIGTLLLFSPNVFPWYLTWIIPLLAIHANPAWLLLTVTVFLSYHVLIPYGALGLWRESSFFIALEYLPFYAWLLAGLLTTKPRQAPGVIE
jgi:hypothetical protein